MERILLSVNEIFGYSSLDRTWIEDHDFDYAIFAAENGWICEEGALAVTFRLDVDAPVVAFGQNPGKKMLRKMAKEQKARSKQLAKTKHLDNE